jgi:predicted PurR-regulated permease PerM
MAIIDTNHQRAALVVLLLGFALTWALLPYATGLIGIPVLYVIFAPAHRWLARHMKPSLAATIVVLLGIFLVVVPGVSFAGLIVNEAQQIATGVIDSPILARLSQLHIGRTELGPELANLGRNIVRWLGTSAFNLVGTATRLALNLTITFFGLYYLLLRPNEIWEAVRPYIPFSTENADKLQRRFHDVTISTLIGTGLTAVVQGILVGIGFWLTGLPNGVFWGVVTVIVAILPVVGSGLVWAPGVLALVLDSRYGAATFLGLWGVVAVGGVDYLVRPWAFRRWAHIHPIVTVIGAVAGVPYFGILGLLIGPLAVSYFFELIRMYRQEYLGIEGPARARA